MDLRVVPTLVGDVPTVAVDGVVDLSSIAVFRDTLLRCIHANAGKTVIVDIDGVSALDDSGLGVLLGAAAAARQADGDLEIVCTAARMRTRLERTRLDRAIAVRESISPSV
jgi:anti-sigma B factor antagonist